MILEEYLSQNSKKHLIFDFDETLFKLVIPWNKYFKELKVAIIKLDPARKCELNNETVNFALFQNDCVKRYKNKTKDLICQLNSRFEKENLQDVIPNYKLINFIKNKNPNYKLFIWSSNTASLIQMILDKSQIAKYFDMIITRMDVDLLKPETDGFLKIYDPRIPKESYLMIGDSPDDQKAAESSGIDFYLENYFK